MDQGSFSLHDLCPVINAGPAGSNNEISVCVPGGGMLQDPNEWVQYHRDLNIPARLGLALTHTGCSFARRIGLPSDRKIANKAWENAQAINSQGGLGIIYIHIGQDGPYHPWYGRREIGVLAIRRAMAMAKNIYDRGPSVEVAGIERIVVRNIFKGKLVPGDFRLTANLINDLVLDVIWRKFREVPPDRRPSLSLADSIPAGIRQQIEEYAVRRPFYKGIEEEFPCEIGQFNLKLALKATVS